MKLRNSTLLQTSRIDNESSANVKSSDDLRSNVNHHLISQKIKNDFSDYKMCAGKKDYDCTACMCHVCLKRVNVRQKFMCAICGLVYHEWCRTSKLVVSNRWMCEKCKNQSEVTSAASGDEHKVFMRGENDGFNSLSVSPSSPREIERKSHSVNSIVDCDYAAVTAERVFNNIINDPIETVKVVSIRKMNNCGRRTKCSIVPPNHFGPIPGIEVGTCWKFRLQVSESGVHRPLVAGIHGRENEGAYSIVLSGVYSEDQDNGDEFYYSGCGGRLSDPSKRFSEQIRDQELKRYNRALALCCNAPVNEVFGAEAVDWQGGKPVRVVRNFKLGKASPYAPAEGNRYDGIYKVVKYFPFFGKNGLKVWRYLLRRDDPSPAPWTEEGKRRINEMQLKMLSPETDGVCEVLEKKKLEQMIVKRKTQTKRGSRKRNRRRSSVDDVGQTYKHSKGVTISSRKIELANEWKWPEPLSAKTAPDIDVKPNVFDLAREAGIFQSTTDNPSNVSSGSTDGEHDGDVKPNLEVLNRQFYTSLESSATEQTNCDDDNDDDEYMCGPQKNITEVNSSLIDIDEDVKPNLDALNDMIARQVSEASTTTKTLTTLTNVRLDSMSPDRSCPEPSSFRLPVINATCSLSTTQFDETQQLTSATVSWQSNDTSTFDSFVGSQLPVIKSTASCSDYTRSLLLDSTMLSSSSTSLTSLPQHVKNTSGRDSDDARVGNNAIEENSIVKCTPSLHPPENVKQLMDSDSFSGETWRPLITVQTNQVR